MIQDTKLQDFLHDWLSGITGIIPNNVMPRWQPEPPNIPDISVDWLAFGIINRKVEGTPYIVHNPAPNPPQFPYGNDELRRHELLTISCSFYGPNCELNATILREGMWIPQNNEKLFLNNLALVDSGDIATMPEFVKEQWLYRSDFIITLRRQIVLLYNIQNIQSVEVDIQNDKFLEVSNTNTDFGAIKTIDSPDLGH